MPPPTPMVPTPKSPAPVPLASTNLTPFTDHQIAIPTQLKAPLSTKRPHASKKKQKTQVSSSPSSAQVTSLPQLATKLTSSACTPSTFSFSNQYRSSQFSSSSSSSTSPPPSANASEIPDVPMEPAVSYASSPSPEVLTSPIFTHVPSFDELLPFLTKVIVSARRIPTFSPSTWKERVRLRWSVELTKLETIFDNALSDPTPLSLFLAVFAFISAPGTVLAPCFKQHTTTRSANSDSAVSSALSKILRGQERKACKALSSHGVAKVNASTIAALKKLHPERKSDLVLPTTPHIQLTVDHSFVSKRLFRQAADRNISKDVYGWAPWMFYACRGEKKGFFVSLTNFICFLANNTSLFPQICALLLSGGSLTPLHKLELSERQLREEAFLPPKLRPINSGSLLSKTILAAVIASPAGQRAAERVQPFQLSLGVSRGVEKLVHICRAAHESKWLVGKNDY